MGVAPLQHNEPALPSAAPERDEAPAPGADPERGDVLLSGARLERGAFKRGPGGRPTRDEAERRHRSLLATTFRLFLEKGWAGVSVEEISRQSGVAKGFIYARYPDKAALFVGAIQRLHGRCHRYAAGGRAGAG